MNEAFGHKNISTIVKEFTVTDFKKLGGAAIAFIVILRISIGWQFLYEGLWKCNTQSTSRPWSAAGYLRNAQGPYRNYFRNMTGDPDEKAWLDYEAVAARWDDWHQRFLNHYPDLTDSQKKQLDILINGPEDFRAILKLKELPKGVTIGRSLSKVIKFDPKRERLIVDGTQHLLPKERDILLKMVDEGLKANPKDQANKDAAEDFKEALAIVMKRSSKFSYKEKLMESVKGNPERATRTFTQWKDSIDYKRIGNIDKYKGLLEKYEADLKKAEQEFQYNHLGKQWAEIQELRAQLVGPVKALETQMYAHAVKLLTLDQLKRGSVPPENTKIRRVNMMTIWGLLILGTLLILGFGTRIAAVGGAVMLLSFYLVMPPWPGVPAAPGPEHSLFVNKNLIEMLALIAIACMPTGQWFGIDGLIHRCLQVFRSRKQNQPATANSSPSATKSTTQAAESPQASETSTSGKSP